jgi:hypothetical protein
MPFGTLLASLALSAATSANLMNYATHQRSLIEIKFEGSAKDLETVDTELQKKVNAVRAELETQDILIMGPQNFGYSVSPISGTSAYNYNGYVFYETSPAEKGNTLLELLKSKGFKAEFGQRCSR